MSDFSIYQSPYSWRYSSQEMRKLWSEVEKRRLWRKIWIALAQAEADFGLVSAEQIADLDRNAGSIDIERATEIEREIHHDLMAEVKTFAEQSPIGGGILHMGATSMDIEDNADALRIRAALDLVLERVRRLLGLFADQIETHAVTPVMAFTHLQPAEPTTLGYRLSFTAQDLLGCYKRLTCLRAELKGKGFKGAVGTAAAYIELIGEENYPAFEEKLSRLLDLPFYPIATQTYPRMQEFDVLSALAALGGVLYKFAFDLRLLQSPVFGEMAEPFGKKQVGSSAMPFKRNPINSEKLDSLARALAAMPQVAWHNSSHSLLERTLDDSANRRSLLPEAFLISDELLLTASKLLKGLVINGKAMRDNLSRYAPFAVTERVMMACAQKGADRQEMHERLRNHSLTAWAAVQQGAANPLRELIGADPVISKLLSKSDIESMMDAGGYTGIAGQCARDLAREIKTLIGNSQMD